MSTRLISPVALVLAGLASLIAYGLKEAPPSAILASGGEKQRGSYPWRGNLVTAQECGNHRKGRGEFDSLNLHARKNIRMVMVCNANTRLLVRDAEEVIREGDSIGESGACTLRCTEPRNYVVSSELVPLCFVGYLISADEPVSEKAQESSPALIHANDEANLRAKPGTERAENAPRRRIDDSNRSEHRTVRNGKPL